MPMGKGTYGDKVGRPLKKKRKLNVKVLGGKQKGQKKKKKKKRSLKKS
ncbi:MAG: hypothetical protein CM1200mV1_450 [uncultured marine virus]|nr:MAG: hypothetical protein CM1200mV1_450 [uncultured marine virus]